jgi:hypothetical protein
VDLAWSDAKRAPDPLMPRPNLHLSQRIQKPLYCYLKRRWGDEDASIPWIDRETLHLLTANWLSADAEHPLTVSLPDRTLTALLSVRVMESFDGRRNPFGMGVLNVCSYRVPAFRDEVALDMFLRTLNPDMEEFEISGPLSYSGRADIVHALRGHLRSNRFDDEDSAADPPSVPDHDRIAIANELLVQPIYSATPTPSLFAQYDEWGALRAALRKGPSWIRLVVRAVSGVEVMDRLQLVLRLPDGVMVQFDVQALKVRHGRLLLQTEEAPSWVLQRLQKAVL